MKEDSTNTVACVLNAHDNVDDYLSFGHSPETGVT